MMKNENFVDKDYLSIVQGVCLKSQMDKDKTRNKS